MDNMIKDVTAMYDTFGTASVKIISYLLLNKTKDNMIYITQNEIANELNVSSISVNAVFRDLLKEGKIVKIRNGCYQLKVAKE